MNSAKYPYGALLSINSIMTIERLEERQGFKYKGTSRNK